MGEDPIGDAIKMCNWTELKIENATITTGRILQTVHVDFTPSVVRGTVRNTQYTELGDVQ